MKVLEQTFIGNYDKSGNNNFYQIKRTDTVAMYKREPLDKKFITYEVFVIKTRLKGQSLPNGLFELEDRECYPGASSFGKHAYCCLHECDADDRYLELIKKYSDKTQMTDVAMVDTKSDTKQTINTPTQLATTSRSPVATTYVNVPVGKFTIKMLIESSGIKQPKLQIVLKQLIDDNIIKQIGTLHINGKRGKAANLYESI